MAVIASAAVSAGLAALRAGASFAVASKRHVEISCARASYRARIALSRQPPITLECFGVSLASAKRFVPPRPPARQPDARGLTGGPRPLYSAGFATPTLSG